VVALITVPTFNLAKSAKINLANCWIPIACALAIWALGVSPIIIIVVAAVAGYVYGQFIKPTEQREVISDE
jgi:chromate transporter